MAATKLAQISFDGIHLLLPQVQVATVESSHGVEHGATTDGAVGRLRTAGGEWPVYALSNDFRPRAECPETYKYCIAVDCDGGGFSLACEQVGTVSLADENELQPLQACMRVAGNPIESLLLKDDRLMLVSDAAAIAQYLLPRTAA